MISSDQMFNKARPEWQPNGVLYPVGKADLPYVKVPWDVEQTANFAPWRLEPLTPQELVADDGFKPAEVSAEFAGNDGDQSLDGDGARTTHPDTGADNQTDAPDSTGGDSTLLVDGVEESAIDPAPPEPEMTTIAVDEVAAQQAAAKQEGYDEGFAAGEVTGFEKGRLAGEASGQEAGREAAETTFKEALRALNTAAGAIETLNDDPRQYFDPLKKLALHLAEELVRGELSQSPAAIERLIQLSLDELEAPAKRIVVQLHPDDLAQIQAHNLGLENGVVLQADSAMTRGSVQVSSNDAVVQDLIQKRLRILANKVLIAPDDWANISPLMNEGPLWATTSTGADIDTATEDATLVEQPQAAVPDPALDTDEGDHADNPIIDPDSEGMPDA